MLDNESGYENLVTYHKVHIFIAIYVFKLQEQRAETDRVKQALEEKERKIVQVEQTLEEKGREIQALREEKDREVQALGEAGSLRRRKERLLK